METMMTDLDLTALEDDELDALRVALAAEQERRETLRTARGQAEVIAERFEAAVAVEPATEWKPGTVVGPGQKTTQGGEEFVNTSGAWLSASPTEYPLGYQRTHPPALEDVPDWDPNGHTYQAGDQVAYGGRVYSVVQGHTSQADWAPDVVPALYTVA